MGLLVTFLALSIGVALVVAIVLTRASPDRHTLPHDQDRMPPLGRPAPDRLAKARLPYR